MTRVVLLDIIPRIGVILFTGAPNMNSPFGRKDFMVHKGATIEIEFSIKDNDRKNVKLRDRSFIFNAINPENDNYVIRKPLIVKSYDKSILSLILNPSESIKFPVGHLRYSISALDEDERLMYMNGFYQAHGWFEVQQLALPGIGVSIELNDKQLFPVNGPNNSYTGYQTGPIPGAIMRGSANSLQTLAIYADRYTGDLYLEGTLEDTPSQYTAWFPIQLGCKEYWNFINYTGIEPFNIDANIKYFRITHIPKISNVGNITKILMNY